NPASPSHEAAAWPAAPSELGPSGPLLQRRTRYRARTYEARAPPAKTSNWTTQPEPAAARIAATTAPSAAGAGTVAPGGGHAPTASATATIVQKIPSCTAATRP